MVMMMSKIGVLLLAFVVCAAAPCAGRLPPRPPRTDYASAARWLVCAGSWGALATDGGDSNADVADRAAGAVPFANVAAFADGELSGGAPRNCSGEPFFYLTALDATMRDLAQNPWASLSVSMASLEGGRLCPLVNAEDPTCWRIALTGRVRAVGAGPARDWALHSLYSRHPDMRLWAHAHEFVPMQMHVEKVFFLDFYGGAHPISVQEYLSAPDPAARPALATQQQQQLV